MIAFPTLVLVGLFAWLLHKIGGADFLPQFAKLLDRPQIVEGLTGYLTGCSSLTGEFRGRNVDVSLKRKRGRYSLGYLVVTMRTSAPVTIESHAFSAYGHDRDAELALFALETRHDVKLTHEPYSLKVLWMPIGFFIFPGRFEPEKWRDVLTHMHALAGSLERRAA
jgi:hypothetical protein